MAEEFDLHSADSGARIQTRSDLDGRDALSLVELTNSILRHRVAIAGLSVGLALFAGTVALLAPRTYTSTATFTPQGKHSPSTISGLAAQFGVSVASADAGASPAFYSQLVNSREVRSDVADAEYVIQNGAGPKKGSLADALNIGEADSLLRHSKTIAALERATTTVLDQKSSVITLSVSMPTAALARQVASRYMEAISRFNLDRRQSQAAAERQFTERRLAEVRTQLREAEDQLQGFLQRNRLMDTPDLQFQRDRLSREVALRQQVYGTIAQAYEQARIDEVRDTPVLTILDRPDLPARPDPRGVIAKALIALIIGFGLGSAGAVVRDGIAGKDTSEAGMAEFSRLRAATITDLRHPIASVKRSWRARTGNGASHSESTDRFRLDQPH